MIKVTGITRGHEDFDCDWDKDCEQDVRTQISDPNNQPYGTLLHFCDQHAREFMRLITASLSLNTNAGGYHDQGSKHVPHPLNEEELRAEAKRRDRPR